jgi:hypothetical protein
MTKRLRWFLITILLCWHQLAAWSDDALIDFQGDHYVIHVGALNPDSEMTLMDVLMLCPEVLTDNARTLNDNFILCVDDIDLFMDNETFLKMVKANEVETIDVYTHPSISQGVGGVDGVINIIYKEADKDGTTGKATVEGSTYGNGLAYADVKTRQRQVSVRGYFLGNQHFAKGSYMEDVGFSQRHLVQDAHVSVDWTISPKDNLTIKLFHQYNDGKAYYHNQNDTYPSPNKERLGVLTVSYLRTLNDKGAELLTEVGSAFTNIKSLGLSQRDAAPYFFTELTTPLLTDDLSLLAGWEVGYDNSWLIGMNRQQYLKNDLYAQLNYLHGPWTITLGNRFTLLGYWNRNDDEAHEMWSHYRNANSYLASVGYKWGHHYVQGAFNRDFYIPTIDDFYEDVMGELALNTNYETNMVWRAELRYTFQQKNVSVFGSAVHSWKTDLPTPREETTGIKTSITWHQGMLRLTAGANFYHEHRADDELMPAQYDNYFTLRCSPALLPGHGWRLSSTLLYHSRQEKYGNHPHLFASLKVNKDLGHHCNVFADFHDLAGMPSMSLQLLPYLYHNRALTLGMTYRF